MSEKKARAKRRHDRMVASRLERKRARVVRSEADREFDAALGEAVRLRDEAIRELRSGYGRQADELVEKFKAAQKEVHDLYRTRRDELVKRYGEKAREAA